MKLEHSQQNLEKYIKTILHKNLSRGAELFHTDIRREGEEGKT
jgi:hypothetical protein